MKIIETHPREKGFVLWGHCQNILDDPRMCIDFNWGIRLNDLIHTAGEGVNSTIIQCVHEQSLTGICIFPVFDLLPLDHVCTNR